MAKKPPMEDMSLPAVYDLKWLDLQMADAVGPVRIEDFERNRRFAHFGAAIAWARRQLFHGKVMGDEIELTPVIRFWREGKTEVVEDPGDPIDITLAGFRNWSDGYTHLGSRNGLLYYPPKRKCRIMDN